MKGTIAKIFHNERSSKIELQGSSQPYLLNTRDRRDYSAGDVIEFTEGKAFGKNLGMDGVRKVGREEAPPAPAPTAASAGAAPVAPPARFQKGRDDPETAARIARSVALTESIALTSSLLQKDLLPLPKDEKKRTEAVLAFMEETRAKFYSYIAGEKSEEPADGAPKGGKVADLGQE